MSTTNSMFYFIITWVVLGLISIAILLIVIFWFIYIKRNDKLYNKMDYMHKLFDNHFKVTDQTILDTRDERDFWKEKALKFEKEKS
jgi:hypothetical protein